ncbi:MAG: WecB/TagA/CpsF family glycosyltransferase [Gammaproteobacteria bacterium]
MSKTSQLLGLALEVRPLGSLIRDVDLAIQDRSGPIVFACANPHSLVVAQRDPAFREALARATFLVADGVGLSIGARLAGLPAGPRITGTDFFTAVMTRLEARAGRVFFFGSTDAVLDLVRQHLRKEFPRVTVCGALSPPFRALTAQESTAYCARMNAAQPDVLWVGMTAPKQEKWVEQHRAALCAPVIGSIGAVFDYYAGTIRRAPVWVCRAGFEWLYRLIGEPRRLWQRNLLSTPHFIVLVLRQRVLQIGRGVPR